jgi:hypothetical protein
MEAAKILCSPPLKAGTLGLEHASLSRLSWLLGSRWKPFEDSNLEILILHNENPLENAAGLEDENAK